MCSSAEYFFTWSQPPYCFFDGVDSFGLWVTFCISCGMELFMVILLCPCMFSSWSLDILMVYNGMCLLDLADLWRMTIGYVRRHLDSITVCVCLSLCVCVCAVVYIYTNFLTIARV